VSVATRVTGLVEFSPIGQLFSSGSFCKVAEIAQTYGLLFSCANLEKKLGYILGDFFLKLIWSFWLPLLSSVNRVTGLGEVSPIGQLLSLGSFLIVHEKP
jgi:hypothetical protein